MDWISDFGLRGCLVSPDRVFRSAMTEVASNNDEGLAVPIREGSDKTKGNIPPEKREEVLIKHAFSRTPFTPGGIGKPVTPRFDPIVRENSRTKVVPQNLRANQAMAGFDVYLGVTIVQSNVVLQRTVTLGMGVSLIIEDLNR